MNSEAQQIRDAMAQSLDVPMGPVQTGAMNATAGWVAWIDRQFGTKAREER